MKNICKALVGVLFVQAAIDKAVSAAMSRRPTKAFQDVVAGGGAGPPLSSSKAGSNG